MKPLENLNEEEYKALCDSTNYEELNALKKVFEGLEDIRETCKAEEFKKEEITRFKGYLSYMKRYLYEDRNVDMDYEIETDDTKGLVVILEFVNSKHTLTLKNL